VNTLRTLALAALFSILGVSAVAPAARAEVTLQKAPVQQLRIYEIFEHNKQAFHERFRDHAMRIMARYDFRILGMWESKSGAHTEFVYLLQWPDEATMKDRWAKFMADPEWIEVKKKTAAQYGQLVGNVQDRTLQMTSYSPQGLGK
jgi:hypothetical protein